MRRMKQFMALGLVVVLSMGCVIGVSAADSKTSDATITMKADGDTQKPTGPLDPWNPDPDENLLPDPDDKDDGDENEVKGSKARVRIDYISNFKFDDAQIDTVDQEVYARIKTLDVVDEDGDPTGMQKELPNYAQISDYRGSGAGWTLSARISKFEYEDPDTNEVYELNGAQVTLNNVYTSNAAGEITNFQKASSISLNGNNAIIMSGKGDDSKGTNMAYFGEKDELDEAAESVELFIPADDGTTLAQTYKAKLTWTLEDTYTP